MRIGITGHRDLTAPTVELVRSEFAAQLAQSPDLTTGISCLAEGADQLFAQSVLSHGGQLDAIVPSLDDRDHMSPDGQQEFDRLPATAFRVTRLPYPESTPEAHMAASLLLVERSDLLLAVWDGQPARSFAGTADVVAYARQLNVLVKIVWPPGSARAPLVAQLLSNRCGASRPRRPAQLLRWLHPPEVIGWASIHKLVIV